MVSSTMVASTLTSTTRKRLQPQQLEMAALHRAREFSVYRMFQYPNDLNQCSSAPYIPPAPSSTILPSSITFTHRLNEVNSLYLQSPTDQPTQMSSHWMTESLTKEFALGDTNQYGINDVNHANLLNADNIKQANENDDVITVRESFMNNISLTDADQFHIDDGNHATLFSADDVDVNQDNGNDDASMVRESFVNNEIFIPEHSSVATKDVDSPPLQSINYKNLKYNKRHSDVGHNASGLSSFTCASAHKAWLHSPLESHDTKSAHMSNRRLEENENLDMID